MTYPITIDLVRHGSTAYNESDRMQGHADIPLSAKGRQEIGQLALRLSRHPYDLVIHSPLTRAKETAQIILEGREGPRVEVYPEFIEIGLGRWEGLVYSEMIQTEEAFYQRWLSDEALAVPGGESFQMVVDRVKTGVVRLRQEPARQILICGHATMNRALLSALLDLPASVARRFRMGNGAWSRFIVNEQAGRIRTLLESWNNTEHLQGA